MSIKRKRSSVSDPVNVPSVASSSDPITVPANSCDSVPQATTSSPIKVSLKHEEDATQTPPAKRLRGILKIRRTDHLSSNRLDTPSPTRSVSFGPPERLTKVLTLLEEGKPATEDIDKLALEVQNIRGSSIIDWLKEMSDNMRLLGRPMAPLIEQILLFPWLKESKEVIRHYQNFLLNIASAHSVYFTAILRSLLKQFVRPVKIEETDDLDTEECYGHVHKVLKGLMRVPVHNSRWELVKEVHNLFPFFKHPPAKLIPYTVNAFEIARYLEGDHKVQIYGILIEKIAKLDASLIKPEILDYIKSLQSAENNNSQDDPKKMVPADPNNMLCESLDKSMDALFNSCRLESHDSEGNFDLDKGLEFMRLMLILFRSHVIPTYKIGHIQFSIFYLANLHEDLTKEFLSSTWKIFKSFNTASIIRQSAISYLSGFICHSNSVRTKLAKKYLKKIMKWINSYVQQDRTLQVDYMHANLAAHGPFYSACQAAFYVISMRHAEFAEDDDLSFLRSLKLASLVTHQLNPLRVLTPSILQRFSKVVSHYQLVYCKSIIERNNRINLPVVGLSSNGRNCEKPLLLDNYFPFDPYILPATKSWVEGSYRKLENDDFSDSEEDAEDAGDTSLALGFEFGGLTSEGDREDVESDRARTEDYETHRRRRLSSSSSSHTRSRKDSLSDVIFDVMQQEITNL